MSRDTKYIGMDVHQEAVVIAVLNGSGKLGTQNDCKPCHGRATASIVRRTSSGESRGMTRLACPSSVEQQFLASQQGRQMQPSRRGQEALLSEQHGMLLQQPRRKVFSQFFQSLAS